MKFNPDDPRLTAYALGELDEAERKEVEALLKESPEARRAVEEARQTVAVLAEELSKEACPELTDEQRAVLVEGVTTQSRKIIPFYTRRWVVVTSISAAAAMVFLALVLPAIQNAREKERRTIALNNSKQIGLNMRLYSGDSQQNMTANGDAGPVLPPHLDSPPSLRKKQSGEAPEDLVGDLQPSSQPPTKRTEGVPAVSLRSLVKPNSPTEPNVQVFRGSESSYTIVDDQSGVRGKITLQDRESRPIRRDVTLPSSKAAGARSRSGGEGVTYRYGYGLDSIRSDEKEKLAYESVEKGIHPPNFNTEAYDRIVENPFLDVVQNPLSTFSIDVDTASYANMRRFLNQGMRPPPDSVRIEELINYFTYDYAPPKGEDPFAVHIEVAECPWKPEHRLARIGIKGQVIDKRERPLSNLVFLIDVSGSMEPENKLPLVKRAMKMLVEQLNENDQVAMVVYAGSSGLVLPSTNGDNKQAIIEALDRLQSGGSTQGSAGIQLAYEIAVKNFIKGGVNRVILCTDGDFNVGITNQGELTRLIEEKAKSGVFLSVLGFGMGNLKDSMMEKLADKGNGNYAYIDTLNEARKVLVEQMSGTLVTIAKDVKIQVEFNPAQVSTYRLIGYENRILAKEDFNDDKKDAGEIGAGHTVTALYEIVPAGKKVESPSVDALRYQQATQPSTGAYSGEMLTVKLRYKQPDGDTSKLLQFPVVDHRTVWNAASVDFRFAASVASFGMILRESANKGNATFDSVLELADTAKGRDPNGYRAEFIELVKNAKAIH